MTIKVLHFPCPTNLCFLAAEPFEVLSAKLGMRTEDIVKLDANENPYGPPPEVLKALGSLKFPHIYPDPESRQLRATLARDHSVSMDKILVRWRCLHKCAYLQAAYLHASTLQSCDRSDCTT